MKSYKYVLMFLFSLIAFSISAEEFSEEHRKEIQQRVKSKIEEFQGYMASIVNDQLSDLRRNAAKESAIALFIGEGEPYYLVDEDGKKNYHREVRMQISSVNKITLDRKAIKKYLQDSYNNIHKYAKVVIESADAVRVGDIYKVGEGKYECMAYFAQKYISYGRDGSVKYGDFSRKKVKVHLTVKEIPTVGKIFEAKLGDIYVVSTEKLKK